MRLILLAFAAAVVPLSSVQAQTWENRQVERLAWPEWQRFESEAEFRRYIREVRRIKRNLTRQQQAGLVPDILVAQAQVDPEDCDPLFANCPVEDDGSDEAMITVTGTRVQSSSMTSAAPVAVVDSESITNNQSAGVDEGDIVKRIGDYLLVLQDGRIFAANFRTMELTDRIDVYRRDEDGDPIGADWYDEMLVQGDHILVTAYSYYDDASELSVFRLDRETGRIERRGVFLISSEDYYDVDNYATRVIGDRLVIYTPYELNDLENRRNRPVVRRWSPVEDFEDEAGDQMLNARGIYRPVFGVYDPVVHTISICDLGDLDEDELRCDSTGFIAGSEAEMYVSPENIYLATNAADYNDQSSWRVCRSREAGFVSSNSPPPGAVFRMPMRRLSDVEVLSIRGEVFNQFSMDEYDGRFRMLLNWDSFECQDDWWRARTIPGDLELVNASRNAFSDTYREAPDFRFTTLPPSPEGEMENRFIGDWLLYGSRSRYGRPPEDDETALTANLFAVPVASPQDVAPVALDHEVTRIESLGQDAIVTGYRDDTGLRISYINLSQTANVADSVKLQNRYESESRSHAFNAALYPEGEGLMGLPTVAAEEESGRYPWNSDQSDISFLRFSPEGRLTDLDAVRSVVPEEDEIEGYDCEVSCVDWYGNARPIFIERSIFALMGTEIVETGIANDRVQVLRRLDLTKAVDAD
ncbi:beta-propeller domain-containing protein [Aurantiacibacter gangjinensis]|uniref:Uncharacterized protein n=1 Tax=Aurantiacibacter gangjinensis TaxID=502682 RepID=A0A0G9MQI2_9SPHN|nr:beta-propeller domain-containing protein [Aurantiacibacter gangjinensis]APE28854.1 hypothetical protein BMF35_a2025 [Aurantiacibacter gangjinensis]KLE32992.1 hypothetical protein AAW01_03020 [Aurantiacibacter gangjinensis]